MNQDARFEDAAEAPLRLLAETEEDLTVISALVQDAVLPITETRWDPDKREFAMLINRFRWEDAVETADGRRQRPYERARAVLLVRDVKKAVSQGVGKTDRDLVLSLLNLSFEPAEAPEGRVVITLAGDGALALDVECLNVSLVDVTRPYVAPSGSRPQHPE